MFNPVPESLFSAALTPAGFKRLVVNREVVYERPHAHNPSLKIRVYTSCSSDGVCRAKGADAVRACLIYDNGKKTMGLAKSKRVNREGAPEAVVQRAISRAREMYAEANGFNRVHCPHCGGPTWEDSKRCVSRCWMH